MSLDPQFLVPTDDSVGTDPTQITHLTDKYNDTSLKLPSTEDNSDSLIKTLPQIGRVHLNMMTLSLLSRLKIVYTQSMLLRKLLRVLTAHLKAKTFLLIKCQKRMVLSLQTFLSLKVNLVQLCHIVKKVLLLSWILRVQVNSCQHNLVIRKTQLYLMKVQILSLKWGFQMTALKIVLLVLLLAKFLQKVPMLSLILFLALILNLQLIMVICKLVNVPDINESSPLSQREGTLECDTAPSVKAEVSEPSEPSPPPIQVRRSTRSTRGMPPTRYGSVISHQVTVFDDPSREVWV